MYSSCILFHCITFFIHGYVQAFRNIRKWYPISLPHFVLFLYHLKVVSSLVFFKYFSNCPKSTKCFNCIRRNKDFICWFLQLQLMIQMICKQVYAHPNSLHEAIQYDFVLLLQFLQLPLLPALLILLLFTASRIRASLSPSAIKILLCFSPSARRTLSCFRFSF